MSDWQRETTTPQQLHPVGNPGIVGLSDPARRRATCTATPGASCVTPEGAGWLASACLFPASVHALWLHRPASPSVLPCGTAFDVVSAPPLPGRMILEQLWSNGPGSGPVAIHRGRVLLFAATGTAQRLPALLSWGEWRQPKRAATAETFPPLICLGYGDSVTVPALHRGHQTKREEREQRKEDEEREERKKQAEREGLARPEPGPSRWLVAPDVRHPWLPGPEVLLRACVRPGRTPRAPRFQASVPAGRRPAIVEQPISGTADRDARVYDVTTRR
jgi:hypothetical protein